MTRVAEELKVSAMTVSNAYNRPDQLSESLREKVFEAAERLGYAGPDPVARSLRRQRTNLAGILYSNALSYAFDDAAQMLFLKGVAAATEEAGMGLVLVPGSVGASPEERASAAADAAVDGFIIYSMSEDDPLVGAALRRRVPTVVIDQPLHEGIPFVGIDDEAAAKEMARHLLDLGHERLAIASFAIGGDGHLLNGFANSKRQASGTFPVTRARLAGYRTVLEDAGLSWDEVPVYECFGSSRALGREAAEALLSRETRPTAILALSDQLALGVVEAANKLGLSVPGDLSVAGFDGVPESAASAPPLTTISQDHAGKGELAGRLLVARLRGEDSLNTNLLPAQLVARNSTGQPPTSS